MVKITADIAGMRCGMCGSHVNDALPAATDSTGYTFVSAQREDNAPRGLFARFKK